MTANVVLFAAEIAHCRAEAVCDAICTAIHAHYPPDVRDDAGLRAGDEWDKAHPMVRRPVCGVL